MELPYSHVSGVFCANQKRKVCQQLFISISIPRWASTRPVSMATVPRQILGKLARTSMNGNFPYAVLMRCTRVAMMIWWSADERKFSIHISYTHEWRASGGRGTMAGGMLCGLISSSQFVYLISQRLLKKGRRECLWKCFPGGFVPWTFSENI